MTELLIYLIESSATLVALYILYLLALRKLTFFMFNRFFLLAIVVLSLLVPTLSFEVVSSAEQELPLPVSNLREVRRAYYQALDEWVHEAQRTGEPPKWKPNSSINSNERILMVIWALYGIGFILITSRLIWSYAWIHRLRVQHPHEVIDGVLVVKVPYQIAPFSFLNVVFVQERSLHEESFSQILAHEKTHLAQHHSFDLLFVQLIAAFLWFNPVVWRLIKSLKATHEYIVDKHMITQGYSLVAYQTLLLRQFISNNSHGLVHHFNLSFIKKRITMMQIKESGWAGRAKIVAAFTAVIVLSLIVIQCNSKLDEHNVSVISSAGSTTDFAIELPQLNNVGIYPSKVELSSALTFRIANNMMTVDGQAYTLEELAQFLQERPLDKHAVMVLEVNKDQTMGFVRDVQNLLRLEGQKKVLYRAQDDAGTVLGLPLLLPPHPSSPEADLRPTITDEFAKANNLEIMKVHTSDHQGKENERLVSDMVRKHLAAGNDQYVVSLKFEAEDTYGEYFTNLFYVYSGFDQIYEERAQTMYGKGFYEIDKSDPKGREEYNAVRKNIPRAISIAENG